MLFKVYNKRYRRLLKLLKRRIYKKQVFKRGILRIWFLGSSTRSLKPLSQIFSAKVGLRSKRTFLRRRRAARRKRISRAGRMFRRRRAVAQYRRAVANRGKFSVEYRGLTAQRFRAPAVSFDLLLGSMCRAATLAPSWILRRKVLVARFRRTTRFKRLTRLQRVKAYGDRSSRRKHQYLRFRSHAVVRSMHRKMLWRKLSTWGFYRQHDKAVGSGGFSCSTLSRRLIFYRGRRFYYPRWIFRKRIFMYIDRTRRLVRGVQYPGYFKRRTTHVTLRGLRLSCRARRIWLNGALLRSYGRLRRARRRFKRRRKWRTRRYTKRGFRFYKKVRRRRGLRFLLPHHVSNVAEPKAKQLTRKFGLWYGQRYARLFGRGPWQYKRRRQRPSFGMRRLQLFVIKRRRRLRTAMQTAVLTAASRAWIPRGGRVFAVRKNASFRRRSASLRRKRRIVRGWVRPQLACAFRVALRARLIYWRARRRDVRRAKKSPFRRRHGRRRKSGRGRWLRRRRRRRVKRRRKFMRKFGPGFIFRRRLLPWHLKKRRISYRRKFNLKFRAVRSPGGFFSSKEVPTEALRLRARISRERSGVIAASATVLRRLSRYYRPICASYSPKGGALSARVLLYGAYKGRLCRRYVFRKVWKHRFSRRFRRGHRRVVCVSGYHFFKRTLRRRVRLLFSHWQRTTPAMASSGRRMRAILSAQSSFARTLCVRVHPGVPRRLIPRVGSSLSPELAHALHSYRSGFNRLTFYVERVNTMLHRVPPSGLSRAEFRRSSRLKYFVRCRIAAQIAVRRRAFWVGQNVRAAAKLNRTQAKFFLRLTRRLQKCCVRFSGLRRGRGDVARKRWTKLYNYARTNRANIRAVWQHTVGNRATLRKRRYFTADWVSRASNDIISAALKRWKL